MNQFLTTSAVMAKLAEPYRSASMLSKEKGEEASKFQEGMLPRLEEAYNKGDLEKVFELYGQEANFDEDYISSLQRLHEQAPGNPKLKDQYQSALSEVNERKAQNLNQSAQELMKRSYKLAANKQTAESLRTRADIMSHDPRYAEDSAQFDKYLEVEQNTLNDLMKKYENYRNQSIALGSRKNILKGGGN